MTKNGRSVRPSHSTHVFAPFVHLVSTEMEGSNMESKWNVENNEDGWNSENE